jgi:zinc transport system substrate-binding protein
MKFNRIVLALSAAALALTGCGSADDDATDGRLTIATSFYPLQYATQQVGGDHVDVSILTQPGAEPHDLELTPKQVLQTTKADALIYLSGFQPSVDDAAKEADDTAFDVSPFARLDLEPAEDEHDHGDEGGDHEGHDHGSVDPHFWLDPTRYADVVDAIADRLATIDPDHAADYRVNATALTTDLGTLDKDLTAGLSDCTSTDLVTGHAAFGYFADRYGFHQESVSGLSPGAEPSPTALADLIAHIKHDKITTVYAETLVPADVAKTLARDSGATVAVLDPIEGLTDASAGSDYLEVMRSNLATVRKGQGCR